RGRSDGGGEHLRLRVKGRIGRQRDEQIIPPLRGSDHRNATVGVDLAAGAPRDLRGLSQAAAPSTHSAHPVRSFDIDRSSGTTRIDRGDLESPTFRHEYRGRIYQRTRGGARYPLL